MSKLNLISFFILAFCSTTFSQEVRNAGFENKTISSWIFTNPAYYGQLREAGYSCTVERVSKKNYAAKLQSTNKPIWGQLKQTLPYHSDGELYKYRLTASVKIQGKHNGFVSVGIRPKSAANPFVFIESEKLNGDTDWTLRTVESVIPKETDSLSVYCTITGDGEVWFDNIHLEKLTERIEQTPEAKKYLDTAIDIIRQHALYKDSVNFEALCATAYIFAADAKHPSDCYTSIRYMLQGLEDNHSYLKTPEEVIYNYNDNESKLIYPTGKIIHNNIGYLTVPPLHAINEKIEKLYSDSLQNLIRSLDSKEIIGWIVDDRNNTGGNGFPMELGLGPIIGNGVSDRTIKNGIVIDSSGYWDGETRDKTGVVSKIENPYTLLHPYPFVAVLINGMVGSSGEGIVLRFKNRLNTRIFGEPTYGLTTAIQRYQLSDSAIIGIAISKQTDRLGNQYGEKLYPDIEISDDDTTSNDEVIDAAVKWLVEHANH